MEGPMTDRLKWPYVAKEGLNQMAERAQKITSITDPMLEKKNLDRHAEQVRLIGLVNREAHTILRIAESMGACTRPI